MVGIICYCSRVSGPEGVITFTQQPLADNQFHWLSARGPAHPSKGPAQPSKGPAHPSKGPAQPSKGPAQPSKGPAHPSKGPAQPSKGPAHPSKGPAQPSKGVKEPPQVRVGLNLCFLQNLQQTAAAIDL